MHDTPTRAFHRLRTAQHYFDCSPAELDDEKATWLDATVERQLSLEKRILASPDAAAVVVSDDELRRSLDELQARYEDSDQMLDDLALMGLSVSELHDALERQLRVDTLLTQVAAGAAVSDAEAKAWYDANPDKFARPERRQVWHLLITLNDEYPENARHAARERIEQIRARAGDDLNLFKKAAQRHSECPSALSEGELGWFPAGQLFPAIDAALFALAAGETSAVIETEVGLHLVHCAAIEPAGGIPFNEVKEKLIAKLSEKRAEQAQREWIQSLAG